MDRQTYINVLQTVLNRGGRRGLMILDRRTLAAELSGWSLSAQKSFIRYAESDGYNWASR